MSFPNGFHGDLARTYLKKLADGGVAAPAAAGTPAATPTPTLWR
jgi:hypothetical protein